MESSKIISGGAPKNGRIAQVCVTTFEEEKRTEPSRSVKFETNVDAIADLPAQGLPLIHKILGVDLTSFDGHRADSRSRKVR
jgi:hypothetical protein